MKIKQLRDLSHKGINIQELTRYANADDVGIDLIACETQSLPVDGYTSFPTGIAIEFPEATFGLVLPRSGLARNWGLTVLGGVIDSGYRGEVVVTLANLGNRGITLYVGNRIAQLVILPYHRVNLDWLADYEYFTQTERGDQGHGSTGV